MRLLQVKGRGNNSHGSLLQLPVLNCFTS